MATRPNHAWIDGKVVPFGEAHVPLDDRGLLFGESLYEVMPIAGGRARLLGEHAARLAAAAPELGLSAGVPTLAEWEHIVRALLERDPHGEALLYAQVTGGSSPRDFVPAVAPPPTFFAYVSPFRFPRDEDVARGISAVSLPDIRWDRRDLKTTMLLGSVLAKREAQRRGAKDALLVGPSDVVHEGASSNVFALEGRTLLTPPQSSNLLPGTMRPLVCEVAAEAGLTVIHGEMRLERVRRADEVFISSSSQLVMPIRTLDGQAIGKDGQSPVARDLARRLRARFDID